LGEGQQYVQRKPAHRSRRVEVLSDGNKADLVRVEDLNDLSEIGERASETIHFVDNHRIDLTRPNVIQELFQTGAIHRAPGEATIVVAARQYSPALMLLAEDEGAACLALCLK
jgi:hypothetical protein